MLDALRRPIALGPLLILSAAAAVLVALYCLAYTALAGRPETLLQSLAWALVNICPWLIALEAAKRADRWTGAVAALLASAAASILLGSLLGQNDESLRFELLRRVPAFAATLAIAWLIRSHLAQSGASGGELPLLPGQIDWVRAAGNYVELRAAGRSTMCRLPIGVAEQRLAGHGFVRIHRSFLVRRDRIDRVRTQDVIMRDGTSLKIGKRYRPTLTA
jgi:hypothetical protein